jgi:hypothetical protein
MECIQNIFRNKMQLFLLPLSSTTTPLTATENSTSFLSSLLVWNWKDDNIIQSWSASFASFLEHIEENPPAISLDRITATYDTACGNCCNRIVVINVPFYGVLNIPFDTFIFVTSAVSVRIYHYISRCCWWQKRKPPLPKGGRQLSSTSTSMTSITNVTSPPVKAKIIRGYKDHQLHQTMEECQTIKHRLRKVVDPDVTRKEKQRRLRKREIIQQPERACSENQQQTADNKNIGTDNVGYLGMTSQSLQMARMALKQVGMNTTTNCCHHVETRNPLTDKDNSQ